jgi:hypothetical protein
MEFAGNRRQMGGIALVAVVVVAGVLLSPDFVLQQVQRVTNNPLLAAGLFLAVYLVRPLFAWPTTVVAVAVGYVYGPVVGFPVALGGTVMSAYLPFAAARYFRIGSGLFGRLGDSGERFFDATGDLRGMVASRLMPAPSDAVSAACRTFQSARFSSVPQSAKSRGWSSPCSPEARSTRSQWTKSGKIGSSWPSSVSGDSSCWPVPHIGTSLTTSRTYPRSRRRRRVVGRYTYSDGGTSTHRTADRVVLSASPP